MSRGSANAGGGSEGNRTRDEQTPQGAATPDRAGTPDHAARQPAASHPPPTTGAANELGGELLECVVRETLSAVNDEATIERIKSFARRNAAREVTEPEVAEELLRVVVQSRFGKLSLPPELPRWLAETLLEDPDSLQRLQTLWTQAKHAAP